MSSKYMSVITERFTIEDCDIRDYIESVLENGASDFENGEDVYEAIGEVLMEAVNRGDDEQIIKSMCLKIYNMCVDDLGIDSNAISKLSAPVHIASAVDGEHHHAPVFVSRIEERSIVNQKKLDKADQKIKQKKDKRKDDKMPETNSSYQMQEATASHSINKKDTKAESAGKLMSSDIHIENFDVSFGGNVLLLEADLHIAFGRRYALVGRNGIGKTTLLKMLSKRHLHVPNHISILHVEQEVVGDDTKALQSVLECDEVREGLLKKERDLTAQLEAKTNDATVSTQLSKVYADLSDIDADKAPARAAVILCGLGFTPEMQAMTTKEFSGGWRMRLALARALFTKPDLLLLDEPTNMLDVRAIIWLEDYLQTWPTTLLLVSHDRSFLNSVATDIVHVHSKKLHVYRGNFEQFVATKDEKLKNQQKEYEAQKAYRDHIQVFINRFRYNANRAAQVQSKLKLLEKLPALVPVEKEQEVVLKFPEVDRVSGTMLRLDEVSFEYVAGKPIFTNVDISAALDSRICIVGENGSGKSTLLKLLIEEMDPTKGHRQSHRGLRIGYFTQHHVDMLEMNMTCVELLASKYPGMPEEEYRRQLGSFGVTGDLSLRPVVTLSGGQKSRVAFAMMMMARPNFLVLDEPTNHLDMETIEALAIAINKFKGGVILVSHDERLIGQVCRELWSCGEKNVRCVKGGFEEYKKLLEEEFKRIGI